MYILGINAYHGDASACIYKDGQLLAATEEERIVRVKHWAGLPVEAVKFCLSEAGIGFGDLDHIAVSRDPWAKFPQKVLYALKHGMPFSSIRKRTTHIGGVREIVTDLAQKLGYSGPMPKTHFIEHHHCHMASAFYASPFEEAALLSIDGMGDFSSAMRGVGKGTKMKALDSVTFPHSLGFFYTMFTQFLGFPHYGDEYKMMGLSPYGQPKYVDKVRDVVQLLPNGLFRLNLKYFGRLKTADWMTLEDGVPKVKPMYSEHFTEQFGQPRQKGEPLTQYHMDMAASVQRVTEEVIFHMAEDLHKKTGMKNLCLAGGVAQNSVANGKITSNTSFERLFVPPAGHDAGTAAGAALYLYHHKLGHERMPYQHQAYTGARFTKDEIADFIKQQTINGIELHYLEDDALFELVAEQLAQGAVVGWFQGRAEFGPRALGNRSIIVDPRRADAKDLLNEKIKRRESFRPFAPSILREFTSEYFVIDDEVPYMEKVFVIKPEKRKLIPAVTHVDGTGRLQTVRKEDAPRYHRLIHTFYQKTKVPILLNTSFNENEPIVNSPKHAFDCFIRTKMDMLVLENYVLSRKPLKHEKKTSANHLSK
ncbi:MAG: carbamoyltransferase [Saprospiraceae bacterium]